jgi:hypothetical protein
MAGIPEDAADVVVMEGEFDGDSCEDEPYNVD